MDSTFRNNSYNFTIIRFIYWFTVLLGITVSLNIWFVFRVTGLILNLLLSVRANYTIHWQKELGLSLLTLPFPRALFPSAPPPPPIKYASFSDPHLNTSVLSRNSPDMEKSRTLAQLEQAWAWASTSLRYISNPVSRRKTLQRRPKKHLTRSRDFCTINSFICCSFFCRDQHVSHTEAFGSVLFLVLLSFTCSW